MLMRQQPLFLSFLLLLLVSACGSKRDVSGRTAGAAAPAARTAKVIRNIDRAAFNTQYLEGSAKLRVDSDKLNVGASATIRLERDAAIWISAKKFGFEAARALIRPDSFFLYNRLQGDYIAEPLSYVERKYNLPARFDLLQQVFLGNAVFLTGDLQVSNEGADYVLQGEDDNYSTEYLIDAAAYQTKRMSLAQKGTDRVVEVLNSNFQPVDGSPNSFAFDRLVRISSAESGAATLELSYSKVELDGPLSMPTPTRRR